MNINITKQLTETQKTSIRALEALCNPKGKKYREIPFSVELNFTQELPSFYLAYEDNKLVGVISLFAPQSNEIEVMGYTHPAYRRQGIFKEMLAEVAQQTQKFPSVERLLLVYNEAEPATKKVVKKWAMPIAMSEYEMLLEKPLPPVAQTAGVTVQPLKATQVETAVEISQNSFGGEIESARNYMEQSMKNPVKTVYGAFVNGELVGLSVLGEEKGTQFLSGVVVSEAKRGHGYGRKMLEQLLSKELKGPCALEVNSENEIALPLYQKLGFVTTCLTYYASISPGRLVHLISNTIEEKYEKKEVLVLLTDEWADWEPAYAVAVINATPMYTVKTIAQNKIPKTSIGGLHTEVDYAMKDYKNFDDLAMIIIPGGLSWQEGEHKEACSFLGSAMAKHIPIAAICGATVFFAKNGSLDNLKHTGDEFSYFQNLQGYAGKDHYIAKQVVVDSNIITANETAAVEFAREIFKILKIDTE